ncbi:TPA: preprotein translocase subunit Sec61beta [Candidatus Woesearchaeota archaeon]|nr:preprotein translocase subunit Sec61beta [Candidatus Woesearchaeota archaeon]HIH42875.1 preprotein translocase subunit Sec61beta [Candidatus Woesearchaeota archaeon]
MAQDKVSMPSSQGGLTRYFDEYKSKISLSPVHVLIFIGIVVLVILFLHTQGYALFGVPQA